MSKKEVYTYIEIVEQETATVVKRIDVTGKSESQIDKIHRGANINLNHDKYYTVEESYYKPQN